jgi:CRISPR/Cas system-associated exonuclease Cas4 (RecB family)
MTSVTAEEIRDFQLCKFLYQKKHIEKVITSMTLPQRDKLVYEFEDAVEKTIKYFYFETMNSNVPNLKNLFSRWERIWFKNVTVDNIIEEEDHPQKNINSYNTDAHAILNTFYKRNAKNPGEVVIINEAYEVPVTERTKARGQIDLVLRFGKNIIIPHFGLRTQSQFGKGTERGYKIILDSIAYRHKTESTESRVRIELLKNGKTIDTVVSDLELKQVKQLSDEIDGCTTFYSSAGNWWCKNCQFSKLCGNW